MPAPKQSKRRPGRPPRVEKIVIETALDERDIETWPLPAELDRILPKDTHRVTENAEQFIICCIMTGLTDAGINAKLRAKKFIKPNEPDLSGRTLYRIRIDERCAIDIGRLTMEARQIGHLSISRSFVQWANVKEAAIKYLCENENYIPKKGTFGYGLKQMTASEVANIAMKASLFLMDTFGSDLASRIIVELDKAASEGEQVDRKMPTPAAASEYLDRVLAEAYERATKRMMREGLLPAAIPVEQAPQGTLTQGDEDTE